MAPCSTLVFEIAFAAWLVVVDGGPDRSTIAWVLPSRAVWADVFIVSESVRSCFAARTKLIV